MFRTFQVATRLAPQAARVASRQQPGASRFDFRTRAGPLLALQARSSSSSNRKDDTPPPKPKIDYEHEKEVGQRVLKPSPEGVSQESSTRQTIETQSTSGSPEANFSGGLKHDLGIVKDTFKLSTVPRESQVIGLLGTVPYLGTSVSTLYLAWNLHQQGGTGSWTDSLLVSHDTAHYLLGIIEPLQLGYGAVIISFLGAIHWGLEYAEKQPSRTRTRFRYGMGLAASALAWPTVLMPLEYALTTQFMAFIGLYFADARATVRGWAPAWYTTYRFLLTSIVGAAILISLLGRARIDQAEHVSKQVMTQNLEQAGIADHETDWVKLEAEEKKRIKKEEEEEKKKKKAKKEAEAKKKEGKSKGDKKDSRDDGKSAQKSDGDEDSSEDGSDNKNEEGQSNKNKDDSKQDDGAKEEDQESGNDDTKSEDDQQDKDGKDDSNNKDDESKDKDSANDNEKDESKNTDNESEKKSESKSDGDEKEKNKTKDKKR